MPKHKRMLCLVRPYNGPLNLIDQEMVYTRHLPADFSILDFWLQGVPYCRVRQCQTAHHIHVRNMSHFRILHGYHRQAIVRYHAPSVRLQMICIHLICQKLSGVSITKLFILFVFYYYQAR